MSNDINSDPNGQAHWRFENGLFLLDETAKNNDLTNTGVVTIAGGAQLEGNQSADFEAGLSARFSIANAALSANFPLKDGDANELISVCMRIKPESTAGDQSLFSIYDTSGKRSFSIYIDGSGNVVTLRLGYNNGDSFEEKTHASALSAATEYFLSVIIDGINKTYFIHIFEIGGATVGSNIDSTFTNELHVGDGLFTLGAVTIAGTPAQFYDGIMDDVCVFNRLLDKTTTLSGEIADIRNEVFSVVAGGVVPYRYYYMQG